MATDVRRLVLVIVSILVSISLASISVVTTVRRSTLSLPTPILAHILGILLPLLNLSSLAGNIRVRSKRRLSLPKISVPFLLSLLDTILITLAAADLRPVTIKCGLAARWAELFHVKNGDAIRRIEDTLRCCGFATINDRAWPFPGGEHKSDACVRAFGRKESCDGMLIREENMILGFLLAVGVAGLMIKLIWWLLVQEDPSWLKQQARARPEPSRVMEVEDEEPSTEGRYLDEPSRVEAQRGELAERPTAQQA